MGEGAPGPDPVRSLEELLREQARLLVERWERRVLDDPRIPEARRVAAPMLRDQVAALIDRIAARLGHRADEHAREPPEEAAEPWARAWKDAPTPDDLLVALGGL